jgi:phytoene dehydrogenase-like protein
VPSSSDIVVWTIVNNALDPTMAPAGGDSMYVYVPTMPSKPPEGWDAVRDRAADAVVQQVASVYDGVKELEINRWVATPADIAQRWGATNGAVLHVDIVLTRSGPLRPALGLGGYRLPVPGLFLGAAGAHPGGGVTGLPGRNAAREILRRPPRRQRVH